MTLTFSSAFLWKMAHGPLADGTYSLCEQHLLHLYSFFLSLLLFPMFLFEFSFFLNSPPLLSVFIRDIFSLRSCYHPQLQKIVSARPWPELSPYVSQSCFDFGQNGLTSSCRFLKGGYIRNTKAQSRLGRITKALNPISVPLVPVNSIHRKQLLS